MIKVLKLRKYLLYIGIILFALSCTSKKPTSKLHSKVKEQLNKDPESALDCPKEHLLGCLFYSLDKIVESRTLFEFYRFEDNLPPQFIKDHWPEVKGYIQALPKAAKQRKKETFPKVTFPKTIPMSHEMTHGEMISKDGKLWLGPEVYPKTAMLAFRPFSNGLPIYSYQDRNEITVNGPHSFHILNFENFPAYTNKAYQLKDKNYALTYHHPKNKNEKSFYFSLLGGGFYESSLTLKGSELHFIKNLDHISTRSISQDPKNTDQLHLLGWSGLNKNLEVNSYLFSQSNRSFNHYLENGPTLATTFYKGENISFVDFNEIGHNEEKLNDDFNVTPAFNHSMLHFTPPHLNSPIAIFSGLGNLKRTNNGKAKIKEECLSGNAKTKDCEWLSFKKKYQNFENCFKVVKSNEEKVKCIAIFEGKIGVTRSIPQTREPQVYIGNKKDPNLKASQLLKDLPQIYDMRGYGRENTFGALLLNKEGIYYISLYPILRLTPLLKDDDLVMTAKSFALLDVNKDKKKEIIFVLNNNRLAVFQDPLQTWTQDTGGNQVYQSLDF